VLVDAHPSVIKSRLEKRGDKRVYSGKNMDEIRKYFIE
jgi:hypothetical protein